MEDKASIHFAPHAPHWKKKDISHEIAKGRGKTNVVISDETGNFPGMFSKSVRADSADPKKTIAGLRREFTFLELLKDSGF
jgi:hypothetical protein